jgi:hypothetical protein
MSHVAPHTVPSADPAGQLLMMYSAVCVHAFAQSHAMHPPNVPDHAAFTHVTLPVTVPQYPGAVPVGAHVAPHVVPGAFPPEHPVTT